jgi:hypothetical protein
MAKPATKPKPFDAQECAREYEAEALNVLVENMRSSQDDIARNDAAYKLWQIANGYETVH